MAHLSRLGPVAFVSVIGLTAGSGFAGAAMKVCQREVSSGIQIATDELEARKMAIEAWTSKSRAQGAENASWHTSIGRSLACSKSSDGAFRCLAKAAPCSITQQPLAPGTFQKWTPSGVQG